MFLIALGFFLKRTWLLRLITAANFSTAVVSNIGNVQGRMRANVPKKDGRNTPGGLTITNMRFHPFAPAPSSQRWHNKLLQPTNNNDDDRLKTTVQMIVRN